MEVQSTHSDVESTHSTAANSPEVMQQVTELLQAQRGMMAAQIKAMMTNSVPPLQMFAGDETYNEDGSFERWFECYED